MGIVGPGFIAPQHIDAVRRLGDVDVIAVAGSSEGSARRKAKEWCVERAYGTYRALMDDSDVQVVHNTTPNHLHFDVSIAALRAGKHVVSDKPLATSPEQCRQLCETALAAGVAHVVTFNYRGNPLVQEMRTRAASGGIGALTFIHGHYLQDWMTDPNVYSWRSDPLKGGVSSALSDIGSHWCDLAEHVSGSRISAVLADLSTVVPLRFSSGVSGEAFAADTAVGRTPIEVTSEDLGSVLLRFANGAKGCFSVGQVLPGHKNNLELEINGRSASLHWRQEQQNELWVGSYAEPNYLLNKDPKFLSPDAARYAHLPAGHQEAWADAFHNVIADAYAWVRSGGSLASKPPATASFLDGYRSSRLTSAMLQSHAAGGIWVRPDDSPLSNREDV